MVKDAVEDAFVGDDSEISAVVVIGRVGKV